MDTMPKLLAEYFWIAGMDSNSYWNSQTSKNPAAIQIAHRTSLINEDLAEAKETEETSNSDTANAVIQTPHTPAGLQTDDGSYACLLSENQSIGENKTSSDLTPSRVSTLSTNSNGSSLTGTKRSSQSSNATITAEHLKSRPKPLGSDRDDVTGPYLDVLPGDFDFDTALRKFATERENFLEDLSFSAGAVQNHPRKPPPLNARIQKVMDSSSNASPSLSKSGSLRRRISLRDLNSMRRAPSVVNRACES